MKRLALQKLVLILISFLLVILLFQVYPNFQVSQKTISQNKTDQINLASQSPLINVYPTFPDLYDPGNYYLELKPGDQKTEYLSVTNDSEESAQIKFFAVDSVKLASGETAFKFADETQTEIGKYIEFHSPEVILNPHEYLEIPFTLTLPLSLQPQSNLLGGISYSIKKQENAQIETRNIIKISVLITENPKDTRKQNPVSEIEKYYNSSTLAIIALLIITLSVISLRLHFTSKK